MKPASSASNRLNQNTSSSSSNSSTSPMKNPVSPAPENPKAATSAAPAPAPAPKEKKKISRLRTGMYLTSQSIFFLALLTSLGCWTCRRRGYKCDEGKPFCHNCTRLNLQCEGYGIRLKWQDDGYFRQHSKAKSKRISSTGELIRVFCFFFQ